MFTEEQIQQVWEKGQIVTGFDSAIARKDACGAWMLRYNYADENSIYGWEIDHVFPKNLGGNDNIENLRPMQWNNNRAKGNDYPSYSTKVKAIGNENRFVDGQYTVNAELQEKLSTLYSL